MSSLCTSRCNISRKDRSEVGQQHCATLPVCNLPEPRMPLSLPIFPTLLSAEMGTSTRSDCRNGNRTETAGVPKFPHPSWSSRSEPHGPSDSTELMQQTRWSEEQCRRWSQGVGVRCRQKGWSATRVSREEYSTLPTPGSSSLPCRVRGFLYFWGTKGSGFNKELPRLEGHGVPDLQAGDREGVPRCRKEVGRRCTRVSEGGREEVYPECREGGVYPGCQGGWGIPGVSGRVPGCQGGSRGVREGPGRV